eukprot:scaffold27513_cov42-Phaeocystis_antarctica.AAC.3
MSTAMIARKRLLTVCGSAYHLAPARAGHAHDRAGGTRRACAQTPVRRSLLACWFWACRESCAGRVSLQVDG